MLYFPEMGITGGGLKIRRASARGGSTPPPGTNLNRLMLSELVNAGGSCVKRLDLHSVTYFVTNLVIPFALL